jgi:hypothetical protein
MHRQRSSRDGRGLNAVLTDAGLARLRRAWPTHLATVRRHMMDDLSELDLPAVTAALQRFASDTLSGAALQADLLTRAPGQPPGRSKRSTKRNWRHGRWTRRPAATSPRREQAPRGQSGQADRYEVLVP